MREFGGLQCFWSDLTKNPVCPHGPTLLFGKSIDGEVKQFYTCSACRDRKLCTFYAEKNVKITETRKKAWKVETKKAVPSYNHRKLFMRFNESLVQSPERRAYCHVCNELVLYAKRSIHSDHDIQEGLSDEQMNNPTTILKPLSNVKKEAQYLFSKKATVEITNMLVKAGAQQVLCIGAPRIHEHITQNFEHKMSSLLLDFDGRFHNFFGPLNYCWYNLFNHNFFTAEGAETYRDFVTQNGGKNTFVICDPPFGGRVEAISQTMKTIVDQHRKWNGIEDVDSGLKIVFIFPYFMESIMRQKSNPSGINGGLKDLAMTDYKVDYENHPLFVTGSHGRKYGSPVRIFTNISLNNLELPTEDGYKYCAKCQKWISAENKHCKKCKSCTSKDGRRYKHCDVCQRCVKPTWKHCDTCERCVLEKHNCAEKPSITGSCFNCGGTDHIGKDCKKLNETSGKLSSKGIGKKRKGATGEIGTLAKKRKSSAPTKTQISNVKLADGKNTKIVDVKKSKTVKVKKTKVAKVDGTKIVKLKKSKTVSVEMTNGKKKKVPKSKVKKIITSPNVQRIGTKSKVAKTMKSTEKKKQKTKRNAT